jgi:hypothetical protein
VSLCGEGAIHSAFFRFYARTLFFEQGIIIYNIGYVNLFFLHNMVGRRSLGPWELEIFLYFFQKSFCKNLRRFEKFTPLNHSPWPTAVSGLTAMGHGGSEVVVGYGSGRRRLQCPRRRHEAAQQLSWAKTVACGLLPWATAVSFLINERKHTFAMACTVLVP